MKTHSLLSCLLLGMVLAKTSYADELDFGKKTPSAEQIIEFFSPASANHEPLADDTDIKPSGKTRSLDMSILDVPKVGKKPKAPMLIAKPSADLSMSLEVVFGYKSTELTDESKEKLKPVGMAFAFEKMQAIDFVVEGHTDTVGSDAYNKNLSKERAAVVKDFLVQTFHIEPTRIQIVGKGESGLVDSEHPNSEVNRRVRIVATK